jgi:hypothetical protein
MTVTILIRVVAAIASLLVLVTPGLLTSGTNPHDAGHQLDELVAATPGSSRPDDATRDLGRVGGPRRSRAGTPDRTDSGYPDTVTRPVSSGVTAPGATPTAGPTSEPDPGLPTERRDGDPVSVSSPARPATGNGAASRGTAPGTRPTPRSGDVVLTELDDDGSVPPFTPPSLGITAGSTPGTVAGIGVGEGFKAGPGCSVQCIVTGIAYARGVGAELVVATDTPARLWIIVWSDDGYHALRYAGDQLRTTFSSTFDDLEPGTSYQALAVAEDAAGFASQRYGTFDTLRRGRRGSRGRSGARAPCRSASGSSRPPSGTPRCPRSTRPGVSWSCPSDRRRVAGSVPIRPSPSGGR